MRLLDVSDLDVIVTSVFEHTEAAAMANQGQRSYRSVD